MEDVVLKEIEKRFNNDMVNIYNTAKRESGYNANRFIKLVSEKGGVEAAKQLISKEGGTYGFEVLWENNRLDLSVEAHVIKEEYKDLFTEEERQLCIDRLKKFGFNI